MGGLPEAKKVNTPAGVVWMIPEAELPAIASRNGWTIDLRDDAPSPVMIEADDAAALPAAVSTDAVGETADEVDHEAVDHPADGAGDLVLRPTQSPAASNGRDGAIEVGIAEQAAVEPTAADPTAVEPAGDAPTMAEALDLALLERLLAAQEGRVSAEVQAQESKNALAALNISHNRTTAELEVERRERMVTADRFREEKLARAVADAKVAELRDRVLREMALADAEKDARVEAMARSARAERDVANALGLMGWRARRRYRKLNLRSDD
ncbi:MAG: hypothetical protein AAF547_20450 [Actinomycetota bacterium]